MNAEPTVLGDAQSGDDDCRGRELPGPERDQVRCFLGRLNLLRVTNNSGSFCKVDDSYSNSSRFNMVLAGRVGLSATYLAVLRGT